MDQFCFLVRVLAVHTFCKQISLKKRIDSILPDPIGRKSDGEGRVRVENETVVGKDPKWRSVINMCERKCAVSERGRG
jgi:hypothetical protein